MNMQFNHLVLLSVVALSTTAPQNFTSHIRVSQVSTTDPTPSSANTAINATGASHATDKVTEASIDISAPNDGIRETVELTTEVVSGTTTEEADDESSTKTSNRTGGGVWTGSVVHEDRSENPSNATKLRSGEVEVPEFGFNFTLPSYFTSILRTVPTIGSAGTRTKTSSEISHTVKDNVDSQADSNAQNFNGGLTIDSNPSLITFNRTPTTSTTTTSSPFVAVLSNSSGHNLLSTSDFHNQKTFIPSGSFDAPSSSEHNLLPTSDFTNQKTFIPSGSFDALSSTEHNLLPTSDFTNQKTFIPSGSFDALSSTEHNLLSSSDFSNQQAPLHPVHLARGKKSLTESKLSRDPEVIAPTSTLLNPDYYVPPFTAVGEDNNKAYNNDYNSQSFKHERTPVMYEDATLHNLNNGGYSGQFQYIIKASNLPGVLATFPGSASSSTVHSSSPVTPVTYSSQGSSLAGSQSNVGHVSLASQPVSHVSILPNLPSSSNINFASNSKPSFGLVNSLKGSFPHGNQQTNADSASGTSRPDGINYSTTAEESITFHTGHQNTKADSASGTLSPEEAYYSTTTEGSNLSVGTNPIFSTRISESTNSDTSLSNKTTEFPLFDSSVVTSTTTVGVEVNTEQKVVLGKPRNL